jgi:uncharacterized protein
MLSLADIKAAVSKVAANYTVKKIALFGSYAEGRATEDSDIDIIVEFQTPHVSLLTLSGIKYDMEEQLRKDVDVIHYTIDDDALIKVKQVINVTDVYIAVLKKLLRVICST